MMILKKIKLFGFDFIAESSLNVIVDDILNSESYQEDGRLPFLITPNVDYIVKYAKKENQELKNAFLNSKYILPDGQPIVWTSKLFKNKIPKRLTGSDLLPLLWNRTKDKSYKVLALTSSEKISRELKKEHNGTISYTLPFFERTDKAKIEEIVNDCVDILLSNNIKIVIVAISFPKQDILALAIYNKLKQTGSIKMPLFCILGASFEFYLQLKSRAPIFIQKLGLEWLYRFGLEPKRLYRRYFIEDIAFISIFFKEILKTKS